MRSSSRRHAAGLVPVAQFLLWTAEPDGGHRTEYADASTLQVGQILAAGRPYNYTPLGRRRCGTAFLVITTDKREGRGIPIMHVGGALKAAPGYADSGLYSRGAEDTDQGASSLQGLVELATVDCATIGIGKKIFCALDVLGEDTVKRF
jgi:hypothetical protein